MLPRNRWKHPELLQCAFGAFGIPCQLDGDENGFAEWTDGPLSHIRVEDKPHVLLRSRGKGNGLGELPVEHSKAGGLLTVQSQSLADALAALAMVRAVDSGLLSLDEAREEGVFDQWRQAAQSEKGAQRLVQLILYSLQPGAKSYEGLIDFSV